MTGVRALVLALCFAAFTATAVGQTPARPRVPPVFTSDMSLYMNFNDGVPFEMGGTFDLDALNKGMRWEMRDEELPGYSLNMTMLFGADYYFLLTNGVCRDYSDSSQYFPMFWFVPQAEYVGTYSVNGTSCDEWSVAAGDSSFNLLVLSSDPNRPVTLIYDLVYGGESIYESFTFPIDGNFEVGNVPDWAFDAPDRCYNDGGFLCPPGDVVTMEMIRFHAADDYDITNKNTADYVGDSSFLCNGLETQNKNQIISLYEVEVRTQWGQYALCNADSCLGGNNHTVGREGSFGLPPAGGQCREDDFYGVWYSLRGDARCNGTAVGNGTYSCAWREVALVKSISLDCLEEVGFADACAADAYTLPFSNSAAVLESALKYDESDGGCPNVYNSTAPSLSFPSVSLGGYGADVRQSTSDAVAILSSLFRRFAASGLL